MGIQMLKLHWKAAKWPMLPVLIAAFGLPMMAGRRAWGAEYTVDSLQAQSAWSVVTDAAAYGVTFPILAAIAGSILGLTAWTWDHKYNHVYALSLPISRWKYAVMKFGGGVILIGATTATFGAGAGLSAALANLPTGLQTYAGALSAHFFVATLSAYALLFALASGTIRTATIVIGSVVAFAAFGDGIFALLGNLWAPLGQVNIAQLAYLLLIDNGGPLSVFASNWMLFDV